MNGEHGEHIRILQGGAFYQEIRGAYARYLRVQTANLGRCWYVSFAN